MMYHLGIMYVCPGYPGSVHPPCYLWGAESVRTRHAGPLDSAARCASRFLSLEIADWLPGGRLHGERAPTPRISTGVPVVHRDVRCPGRQRRGGCGHGPVRLARNLWSALGSPSWGLCFGRPSGERTDRTHPSRGRPAIPSAGWRLHPQAGDHLGIRARIRGRWKGYRGNRPDVRRTDLPSRSLHPSTLHLWWARWPLAACRAMLLGLFLPDPADEA